MSESMKATKNVQKTFDFKIQYALITSGALLTMKFNQVDKVTVSE